MGDGAGARQFAGDARTVAPKSRQHLRIAFLCFYPDWGHVLPLLKIAKAAQEAGHSVKCYVPERTKHLGQRYGVPVFPLEQEPEQHAVQDVLKVLGSKSIFFLQHSGYGHWSLFLDPPVLRAAAGQLDYVIADVKAFAPDVVVGDRHNLAPAYELIGRLCGARYVSNGPSGSLAHLYRPYVTFYGKPINKACRPLKPQDPSSGASTGRSSMPDICAAGSYPARSSGLCRRICPATIPRHRPQTSPGR